MRPQTLNRNGVLRWVLRLVDPTDGVTAIDADSIPTVAVRKNGVATVDAVTVTKRSVATGVYDCSFDPAGENVGDTFSIEETATISSTAYVNGFEVIVENVNVLATGTIYRHTARDDGEFHDVSITEAP